MKVCQDYDYQFDCIQGLSWYPWVGINYDKAPRRILIVAESQYNTGENALEYNEKALQHKYTTREVVQRFPIEHKGADNNPMFENLHRALLGTNNINRNNLWNHISFYNFIQRQMNYNYKERPIEDDFKIGWNVFFSVIRVLNPTDILFVGVAAADNFSEYAKAKNIADNHVEWNKVDNSKRYARKFTVSVNEDQKVECYAIQHTSHHFSWKAWHEFLKIKKTLMLNELKKWALPIEVKDGEDTEYINMDNVKQPPYWLKHKPIYACDYNLIYPKSDLGFISIGRAQWDNKDSLSVKAFRYRYNSPQSFSRMSEEIPVTRFAEMAVVLLSSIKAIQDSRSGKPITSSFLHETFVADEKEFLDTQLHKESESLKQSLAEIKRLLADIDLDSI